MKTLKVSLQVAITICFSLFTINYTTAQTTLEVSGDITENSTWSADTVKVLSDVTILSSKTLTIDQGTYVEFQGYYALNVEGRIIAIGGSKDTIVFTVKDTAGFYR